VVYTVDNGELVKLRMCLFAYVEEYCAEHTWMGKYFQFRSWIHFCGVFETRETSAGVFETITTPYVDGKMMRQGSHCSV